VEIFGHAADLGSRRADANSRKSVIDGTAGANNNGPRPERTRAVFKLAL